MPMVVFGLTTRLSPVEEGRINLHGFGSYILGLFCGNVVYILGGLVSNVFQKYAGCRTGLSESCFSV